MNIFLLLFALTAVVSAWVLGLRSITDDGKIFNFVRRWASAQKKDWLFDPVILCPACMPSFWGITICTLLLFAFPESVRPFKETWKNICLFPFPSIASSFIAQYFWTLYQKVKKESTACTRE